MEQTDPFAVSERLDPELEEIVAWIASKSPDEVNKYREEALQRVEAMAEKLKRCGETERWLQGADPVVRQVRMYVCIDRGHDLLYRLC